MGFVTIYQFVTESDGCAKTALYVSSSLCLILWLLYTSLKEIGAMSFHAQEIIKVNMVLVSMTPEVTDKGG